MKVLGLAALAVFAIAATQNHSDDHEVIRAQRFQVVDDKGNVIADLGPFGNKNHPDLFIYDSKGVVQRLKSRSRPQPASLSKVLARF